MDVLHNFSKTQIDCFLLNFPCSQLPSKTLGGFRERVEKAQDDLNTSHGPNQRTFVSFQSAVNLLCIFFFSIWTSNCPDVLKFTKYFHRVFWLRQPEAAENPASIPVFIKSTDSSLALQQYAGICNETCCQWEE